MKYAWNPAARPRAVTAVIEVGVALDKIADNPALPLSEHRRLEILTGYELALLNMTAGHGSEESMDFIATALNTALVLAEMGYEEDALERIVQAQEGTCRAVARGLRTGRWGFDGATINAVREAFRVHDEQLQKAPKRDIRGALEVITWRKQQGIVHSVEPA